MKEFSIPLKNLYERPVIELYGLPALIDTVAVIPVFFMSPTIIEKFFETKLVLSNTSIGGLGGYEKGSVYSVSEFKVGDLIFEDFEFFVPDEPKFRFQFLLSATLFYGMDYEFDTINGKFIVRMKDDQPLKRDFKVKNLDGKLYPQIDGVLLQDINIDLIDYYLFD